MFYQITSEDLSKEETGKKLQTIAELFTLLENTKAILNLETYSLSQNSLEQIFLSFAKEQRAEMKVDK